MINEQINDQIVAINILTNNFLKFKNYFNADTKLDADVKKILDNTLNFEIKLMNKRLRKEYIKIEKEIAAKKDKIKNLDASLGRYCFFDNGQRTI